jgi:DNA-binding transcriptional LysR family regulator
MKPGVSTRCAFTTPIPPLNLPAPNGVSLSVAFQASNTVALMGLVRAGLGITILPESIVPALHAGLEARPIEKSGFTIDTLITWRRSNKSLLIHDFIDAATNLATRY